jgi:hypothetical protein
MKVVLRKVTKIPLDFEVKSDKMTFKGYLEYHSGKLILLKANLSGLLLKDCDICAEEFELTLNEDIEFFISDGLFKDDGSVEYDVVESLDGNVEIEELLNSEIELIKNDYHSCDNCKNKN